MTRFHLHKSGAGRLTAYSSLFMLVLIAICAVCGCSDRKQDGSAISGNSVPEYYIKVSGNRPFGVAINSGTMYIVTAPASGNGMLSKVSQDGTVQDFVKLEGDFSGNYLTDKSFISCGIDFDAAGNAYITLGDRLIRISPDGTVSTIADGFVRCFDVKIDRNGNVYVADDKADTIYKFTPSMERSVFYKGALKGDFILTSLALDSKQENLYAREGRRIIKFKLNRNGSPSKPKCVADNMYLFTICLDTDDIIYACTDNSIIRIDGKTKATTIMRSIINPDGMCFGKTGFDANALYVAVPSGIMKIRL